METTFEDRIKDDLHKYLCTIGETDERFPECPDVEDKWEQTAKAYLPDGIREFGNYPTVSLGWMMYIGMAMAKLWDTEWDVYSKLASPYTYMRDKRGYDNMDEYIREEVLLLKGDDYTATEKLVGECAARVHNMLRRENITPATPQAFTAYVACLHRLYLAGMAVQLKRMGYHMTRME